MPNFRLFVSGIAPDVSQDDLRSRFASMGSTVVLHVPEPRVLAGEPLPRGFVHVEVADADEGRVRKLLQAVRALARKPNTLMARHLQFKCSFRRPEQPFGVMETLAQLIRLREWLAQDTFAFHAAQRQHVERAEAARGTRSTRLQAAPRGRGVSRGRRTA